MWQWYLETKVVKESYYYADPPKWKWSVCCLTLHRGSRPCMALYTEEVGPVDPWATEAFVGQSLALLSTIANPVATYRNL